MDISSFSVIVIICILILIFVGFIIGVLCWRRDTPSIYPQPPLQPSVQPQLPPPKVNQPLEEDSVEYV